MSIIQDALKKVQDYKEKSQGREKESIRKDRLPKEEISFLEKSNLPQEKRAAPKNKLRPFALLIVIFAVLFGLVIKQYFWNTKTSNKVLLKDTLLNQETTYKPITGADTKSEEKAAAQETIKNAGDRSNAELPNLVLSGVMYLDEGAQAIINNSIVQEGDTISGAIVTKINRRSVILRSNDVEITLTLK